MKKMFFIAACFLFAGCGRQANVAEGVILDATMNTLMIVTGAGDTLSFSTMDADKTKTDGLLIGDTVKVGYVGEYETGIGAESVSDAVKDDKE